MRNRTAFLTLTMAFMPGLFAADTLTQGERDFALSSLHGTSKLFLDSIAGLSKAQWNFKPAPDRWSIAEVAEHIVLSETGLAETAKGALKQPADASKRIPAGAARAADQKLLDAIVDRSHKATAPETLKPKQLFKTPAEAAAKFKPARAANIDFIDFTKEEMRDHFAPGPFGPLDAYQFFLLMSAHTKRHTLQILEVKAAPGYPKK